MGTITNVTKVFNSTSALAYSATRQECTLMAVEKKFEYLSEILKHQGYLFLNSAYSEFGLLLTREGQKLGWLNDENGLKIEWHAVENSNAVEVTFMNLRDILNELPSEEEL